MWKFVKKKLFERQFKKAFSNQIANTPPTQFSIGILYGPETLDISRFSSIIQKEYTLEPTIFTFNPEPHSEVTKYSKKDVNWLGIPKNEGVQQFLKTPLTILFVINPQDLIHLHYIASLHPSLFKCSQRHYGKFDAFYNLTVEMPDNLPDDELLAEMIQTINRLKITI